MNRSRLKDVLRKTYKYVVWGYGYRFFTRFHFYRLLRPSPGKQVPGGFRILTFHDVPKLQHDAFERLICHLLEVHGIITPAEAEARLTGATAAPSGGKTPCLLTFDDGFESNASLAKAVLSKYGLHAIFFVCPDLMDLKRDQHPEAIVRHIFEGYATESEIPDSMKFMNWDDVAELARLGHTIGSHTLRHSRLNSLTEDEQEREIFGSANRLEAALGVAIDWFAYPFGDLTSVDASSVRIARERYRFCCTGLRGLNSVTTNPGELLREAVDLASPVELQHLVVAGGMDFRHQKKVKQFTKLAKTGSTGIKASAAA